MLILKISQQMFLVQLLFRITDGFVSILLVTVQYVVLEHEYQVKEDRKCSKSKFGRVTKY